MRTPEKAIRCVILDGKAWKKEMYSFLCSYTATPHSSTEEPQATALFNRNTRTTLPKNSEALKSDRITKEADATAMKQYADKREKAKYIFSKPFE